MSAVLSLPNGAHVLASEVKSITPHLSVNAVVVSHGKTFEHIALGTKSDRDTCLAELGAAWREGIGEDPETMPFDAHWQHKMHDLAVALGFDPTHHPSNLICAAIEVIKDSGVLS